MNKEQIKQVYNGVYNLFRNDDEKKSEYPYTRKNWIFPNHLNIMADLCKKMCKKYGGDIDICILASLLHDTGLVYKRTGPSSKGHEKKSLEYALSILKKYGFSQKIISQILGCIKATNPKNKPKTVNEKIVRTADALSQFLRSEEHTSELQSH